VEGVISSNRENTEPPARECADWVLKALASDVGTQPRVRMQVMRNLLRSVLENAARNEDGKPSSKSLEKELIRWRLLLLLQYSPEDVRDVHNKETHQEQAQMLFEVQGFCHDNGFPGELIKKIFYALYDNDIVLEEAYTVWRETDPEDEPTPGKLKALFQANEFLVWLASADEEG